MLKFEEVKLKGNGEVNLPCDAHSPALACLLRDKVQPCSGKPRAPPDTGVRC